jgi:uncharacterized membrane protein YkoI
MLGRPMLGDTMKHALTKATLALALGVAMTASTTAFGAPATYHGHELASQARIGLAQAEKTALAARPGEVTDRELEKEKGGSGLRWSFDIKAGGKTYEVGVDAKTGQVLENKAEGPHPD